MKLVELFESNYQKLYHSTTFDKAVQILSSGYIHGSKPRTNRPDEYYGISTSRDKNLWFGDEVSGMGEITFVLDQSMIRTKYKVKQYDYFNPDKYNGDNLRRRESEEKILTQKLPLSYINEIIYKNLDEYQLEELEILIDMNDLDIPLIQS